MYCREDYDQISIDVLFLPFGGTLRKDNRWVKMAAMMPWRYIDEIYAQNMSGETGRPPVSSRIAFGSIFIKEFCNLTDEGAVSGCTFRHLTISASTPHSIISDFVAGR